MICFSYTESRIPLGVCQWRSGWELQGVVVWQGWIELSFRHWIRANLRVFSRDVHYSLSFARTWARLARGRVFDLSEVDWLLRMIVMA